MEPIELPINVLQAALMFSSKQDVRFYLKGVALNEGNIVATDGTRMFYMPWELHGVELIIPNEAIVSFITKWKKLTPAKTRPAYVKLRAPQDGLFGAKQPHTLEVDSIIEVFQPLDAKFPQWKRIIPKLPEDGETRSCDIEFDWAQLADAAKASGLLIGSTKPQYVRLTHNGDSKTAGHIDFRSKAYPQARALVMPVDMKKLDKVISHA